MIGNAGTTAHTETTTRFQTLRRYSTAARAAVVSLFISALTLVTTTQAFAQEYEPVTDLARPKTDPSPFLIAAYGFIWAAVVVYVVSVARGLGRANREIAELRRRIDAN